MDSFLKPLRKNWVYVALGLLLLSLSLAPVPGKKIADPKGAQHALRDASGGKETLFVEFGEARRRTEKLENIMRSNAPLNHSRVMSSSGPT